VIRIRLDLRQRKRADDRRHVGCRCLRAAMVTVSSEMGDITMSRPVTEPAVALPGSGVYVPASMTPLLLAALSAAARQSRLVPEMEQLAAVCGRVASEHRQVQARRADLERRAANAGHTRPGVLASAQMPPPSEEEITVSAVADRTGLTGQRVRQLAAAGLLPGRKAGRCWYFTRTAVDEYMEERTNGHVAGPARRDAA
jgi:excisionase family DNA binding protein